MRHPLRGARDIEWRYGGNVSSDRATSTATSAGPEPAVGLRHGRAVQAASNGVATRFRVLRRPPWPFAVPSLAAAEQGHDSHTRRSERTTGGAPWGTRRRAPLCVGRRGRRRPRTSAGPNHTCEERVEKCMCSPGQRRPQRLGLPVRACRTPHSTACPTRSRRGTTVGRVRASASQRQPADTAATTTTGRRPGRVRRMDGPAFKDCSPHVRGRVCVRAPRRCRPPLELCAAGLGLGRLFCHGVSRHHERGAVPRQRRPARGPRAGARAGPRPGPRAAGVGGHLRHG